MEKVQKAHIQANMEELINKTRLNASFLAVLQQSLPLSREDVETIEFAFIARGAFSAGAHFYKLMMTRANSYELLIKALDQQSQSGASKILKRLPGRPAAANSAEQIDRISAKIIGKGDCKVYDIVEVMGSSDMSRYCMARDWKILAMELGSSLGDITKWQNQILFGERMIHIFHEILEEWRSREDERATLSEFLEIIERLQWKDFSEELKKKFS